MVTWDDVSRICAGLPGTAEERDKQGHRGWRVGTKGRYAWERPLRRSDLAALGDAAPAGELLALHTGDQAGKDAHLEELPHLCSTIPHFDGYPIVLVRLDAATERDLEDLLGGAWLLRAPARLVREHLDGPDRHHKRG
ncbi:MAG: MmcQ/YjbR family DNA-binding protein [Thermoleophilia bacterium]|nr:MmcQ/YjbR family DNA-binding protein [Thermoleophilia bacterium]